jgi:hypothetical protein
MVLLQVDTLRTVLIPFERDAPWSVDMHRIARRIEAAEAMEIEAGLIQLRQRRRRIECVEPPQNSALQVVADLGGPAGREQLGQALVPESPDHWRRL